MREALLVAGVAIAQGCMERRPGPQVRRIELARSNACGL
jgi:hypothetical protein